jgi:pyruvate dehydrogenase E2 component (dihydrolipoamide acetyltransferase)
MPIEIQLPRLGWSMEEGKFLAWLKLPGDAVKEGEPLFTLESDKAAQDVEAIDNGILCLAPGAPLPGDIVKVGHVLGWLLADGETAPVHEEPSFSPAASSPAVAKPAATPVAACESAPIQPTASAATSSGRRPESHPASPRARRAAKVHRVDLISLTPTGIGGRVRERDVLAAVEKTASAPVATFSGDVREVPVTPRRRAIAERLAHSRRDTVPVTLTCRVDAGPLLALRQQIKKGGEAGQLTVVPTLNDMLVKFTAVALQQHPLVTGVWAGDRILLPSRIDVGMAVDTEDGLLVPVVRNPAASPLSAVAEQTLRLIAAARGGSLTAADMQGGCFTVSNLGSFGIETFTPVLNPPETAILGVGAITRDAVPVEGGGFAARDQLSLSLTFDHRVIDGAPAARFLRTLRWLVENPIIGLA